MYCIDGLGLGKHCVENCVAVTDSGASKKYNNKVSRAMKLTTYRTIMHDIKYHVL